jgi:DNA-binding response OmpR family regulator
LKEVKMNSIPPKRALVVDDEPVIVRIFEEMLVAEGFSVDIAADGDTARDMVTKDTFDLCILNIHIPGINGMELYEFLEKDKPDLSSRTLFTTGDVLSGDIQAFLERSGRPCLLKPFNPDELRIAVRSIMNPLDC